MACIGASRQPREKSSERRVAHKSGLEEDSKGKMGRSNLEMIMAVPWRKNEDNAKMDGERL